MPYDNPAPQSFSTLQAARGVAAILVVLSHAGLMMGMPEYLNHVPMGGVFESGYAGVDFFFVLSGFIITHAHWRDASKPKKFIGYVWKRLTRIYPIYWIALVISLWVASRGYMVQVGIAMRLLTPDMYHSSFSLIPSHESFILGHAWTLSHELLFYGVFSLIILNRWLGIVAMSLWLCASVAVMIMAPFDSAPYAPKDFLTVFYLSPYHLHFALGIGACVLLRYKKIIYPYLAIMIGIAGMICTAALEQREYITEMHLTGRILYGLFSTVLIIGFAGAEKRGLIRCPSFLVYLGSASYAIYLMHSAVMAAFPHIINIRHAPDWIVMLEMSLCGVIAGILLHTLIERHLMRLRSIF